MKRKRAPSKKGSLLQACMVGLIGYFIFKVLGVYTRDANVILAMSAFTYMVYSIREVPENNDC